MKDNPEVTMTEQDELDIAKLLSDPNVKPVFKPILTVWREILSHVPNERTKPVTPQWAVRMLSTFVGLSFGDLQRLQDSYFDKMAVLAQIVDDEIASDDECLKVMDVDEDRTENAGHYLAIITAWQKKFMGWELDWRTENADAAIELAAISESHTSLFGNDVRPGIVQYLDSINLRFTDEDQAELQRQLHEMKNDYEEDK